MTALEAAQHLLSVTPSERIHTHWQGHFPKPWGYKRSADESEQFLAKLLELERRGYDRKAMRAILGCSTNSIIKHLGRVTKKAKPAP